jgi:hypothetical protein
LSRECEAETIVFQDIEEVDVAEEEKVPGSFSLPSNSGWRFTRWILASQDLNQEEVVLSLEVNGDFWDRSVDVMDAELVSDYKVQFPQIVCDKEGLITLLESLSEWLDGYKSFRHFLCDNESQIMRISFGSDDRLIASIGKSVFSGLYSAEPSVRFEWVYVVDESCVRIMMEELREVLMEASWI